MGWVALAALTAGPVLAEEAVARFTVSAFVPKLVTLTALEAPALLELSESDVERGYKDVVATYEVWHNDPAGYLLRLAPRVGVTSYVAVQGPGVDVVLRDADVEIHQQFAERQQSVTLGFRFVLEPATPPGSYPLPVHVSAVPL